MQLASMLAPLAMTMGDPSGIGPELAIKAWSELRGQGPETAFFVIADPDHLTKAGASVAVLDQGGIAAQCRAAFAQALPVLPLSRKVIGEPGRTSPEDARPTIESIERAVELVARGSASALVTNPITKDALYRSGFTHPGHTEFLAELAHKHYGVSARSVMMLWCEDLAVVPCTIHIPLARVLTELTRELIVDTATIVAHDLRAKFGIAHPRIAISGLNPHAGENGALGREDGEIIAPAIEDLRAAGLDVRGPLPADTMFHAQARATYDAAICMYHDQALIPIKTIAFDSGVNVTLGLPFIRTSPDHGTAYDIAGKGLARPDSLIAALRLATRLAHSSARAAA